MKDVLLGCLLTYILVILLGACSGGLFNKYFITPIKATQYVFFLIKQSDLNTWWFYPETTNERGVTKYDKEKSWGDYTMFATADGSKSLVMDMNGKIVHEWNSVFPKNKLSFNDSTTASAIFSDPEDRGNIYSIHVGYKNAVSEYSMIKFDRNSNILWETEKHIHHDIAFLGNGNFMAYHKEIRNTPHPALPQINFPFFDEFLIFVNDEGKVYREISIYDAFNKSEYKSVTANLSPLPGDPNMPEGDFLHPNTITLVPDNIAEAFPNITKNSVMLSFRNISMIAFLDLETETITWALYGPWRGQHSTQFLDNGHIIMFDNQGHTGPEGGSRILEVDLKDLRIVWEYTGTKEKPFFSVYKGTINILPNGNVLITETHSGRIFEITKDKEIVWEYYADKRAEYEGEIRIPSVFSAQRFTKDQLASLLQNKEDQNQIP